MKIRLWNNVKIKKTKQNKTKPKISENGKTNNSKIRQNKTASKTTKTKRAGNVQNHNNIRQQQKKEKATNIGNQYIGGKFDHKTFFHIDDVFTIVTLHVLHASIMLKTIILRDKIIIKKKLLKNIKYKLAKQQAL